MSEKIVILFGDEEQFYRSVVRELTNRIEGVTATICLTATQLHDEMRQLGLRGIFPDILVISHCFLIFSDIIDAIDLEDRPNHYKTVSLIEKFIPLYRKAGFKGKVIAVGGATLEINELMQKGATDRADGWIKGGFDLNDLSNVREHERIYQGLIDGIVKIVRDFTSEDDVATEEEAMSIYALLPRTAERKRDDETYLGYFDRVMQPKTTAST